MEELDLETVREVFRQYRKGKFYITKSIGEGGMASVFAATDTVLGVPRAIKILKQKFLAKHQEVVNRFMREAETMAKNTHPNIVHLYDIVDEIEGFPFLVLEWMGGGSLAGYLVDYGAIPTGTALAMLIEVCKALELAHANGVIHRDIKPGNILLTHDRKTAKLTDFGIAHISQTQQHLTMTGVPLGSPGFWAPEQWKTPKKQEELSQIQEMGARIGPPTDIYALGVTLWGLLTASEPPISFVLVYHRDSESQTDYFEGIPDELAWVIRKATATQPYARYQTVAEFRQDLEQLVSSFPVPEPLKVEEQQSHEEEEELSKRPVYFRTQLSQAYADEMEPGSRHALAVMPDGSIGVISQPRTLPRMSRIEPQVDSPPRVDSRDIHDSVFVSEKSETEHQLDVKRIRAKSRRKFALLVVVAVVGLGVWFWRSKSVVREPVKVSETTKVAKVEPQVSAQVKPIEAQPKPVSQPPPPVVVTEKQKAKESRPSKSKRPAEVVAAIPKSEPQLSTNVRVSLELKPKDESRVWLQGSKGKFELPAEVPAGDYEIVASFVGHEREYVKQGVNIRSQTTVLCNPMVGQCRVQ